MASIGTKVLRSKSGRRVIVFLALTMAVFGVFAVVGTALAPPDAYTSLLFTVPGIVVSLVVGYYLVYGRGIDYLDRLRQ